MHPFELARVGRRDSSVDRHCMRSDEQVVAFDRLASLLEARTDLSVAFCRLHRLVKQLEPGKELAQHCGVLRALRTPRHPILRFRHGDSRNANLPEGPTRKAAHHAFETRTAIDHGCRHWCRGAPASELPLLWWRVLSALDRAFEALQDLEEIVEDLRGFHVREL